ncbi:MAG TPA: hypothetical protein VGO47_05035 [Chlamydiales bacterium]|nr:hypothetical protein [Chlamydiales bacterium]
MSSTLYLLRQKPEQISPSLFQASEADIDIIFIEEASSMIPSSIKGAVVTTKGMTVSGSRPTLTYDDLVYKIFSSDHIVVL